MSSELRKVEYSFDDMIKQPKVPHLNLPDLKEVAAYNPKDNPNYLLVECETSSRDRGRCPRCGTNYSTSVHGSMPNKRYIHDVNVGITQVDLLVTVPRYRCEKCGQTFSHRFSSIVEGRQFTNRLMEQLRRDCFVEPFTTLAERYGISIGTVENIFDDYAAELKDKRGPVEAPNVLGIDEKHIVHAARAVFTNIETGELLEMRPTNKKKDIVDAIMSFENWEKNIIFVTIDMAGNYKSYLQEILPFAKIVVDKFHVLQDLSRHITQCKTAITEAVNEQIAKETDVNKKAYRKELMRQAKDNAYLFKFGQKKLMEVPERITLLGNLTAEFPEFNHLRMLKETFELMYDCLNRASAESVYEEWLKLVPPQGKKQKEAWEASYGVSAELFAPMRQFKNGVTLYNKEIFNFFDEGCYFTNATTEGLNNMIERINRQGNGYSFERLRAKALYWHIAAPPIRYKFNTRKQPVYKEPRVVYFMLPGTMNHSRHTRTYVGMEEITEIVEDSPGVVCREPLCMHSYLPKDYEPL